MGARGACRWLSLPLCVLVYDEFDAMLALAWLFWYLLRVFSFGMYSEGERLV